MSKITMIWAQGQNRVIGNDGAIPWHIPQDLAFFKEQTMGAAVVMGRKTWESIPEKYRPLVGRVNIILTRKSNYVAPGALVVHSVQRAIDTACGNPNIIVIGGDQVYRQFAWYADTAIVTEVDQAFAGDSFAPEVDVKEWALTKETHWAESAPLSGVNNFRYRHRFYDRPISNWSMR